MTISKHISVLVSIGCHPESLRDRLAEKDSRALSLALKKEQARVEVLHGGNADHPVLREYLGLGADRVAVAPVAENHDPVDALIAHLKKTMPDVICTGLKSEKGFSSGMVPFLIAEKFGFPIITNVSDFEFLEDGRLSVISTMPRGMRRKAIVKTPVVLTIGHGAPATKLPSYVLSRRGKIDLLDKYPQTDIENPAWPVSMAKPRPKKIKGLQSSGEGPLINSLFSSSNSSDAVYSDLDTDQAADVLLKWLNEKKIFSIQ